MTRRVHTFKLKLAGLETEASGLGILGALVALGLLAAVALAGLPALGEAAGQLKAPSVRTAVLNSPPAIQ